MTEFQNTTKLKNEHEWYYAGTFFWINSKRLLKYMKINKIDLPEYCDRFYDEDFLGNIYPIYLDKISLASSYYQRYMFVYTPNYPDFISQIEYLTRDEKDKFNNFVLEMTK